MRVRDRLSLLIALLAASGCAGSFAPAPPWLPARGSVAGFPYGGYADVRSIDDDGVRGELISVSAESTYVLTQARGLVALPTDQIRIIAVRTFQPPGGLMVVRRGPLSQGVEGARMKELRSRARYPQGLPPEIDRSTLRLPSISQ